MPGALPDADALFLRFFEPWLKPEERERRGFAATLPDLRILESHRGAEANELSPLGAEMQAKVHDQIARMVKAARADWKEIVGRSDVLSRDGLLAIDAAFDEPALRALIGSSDPADYGNSLVVTCCELGAVLGEALRAARPTFQWVPDWPYWESLLVDRATGAVIPPFHWALRRLSASGINDGLVEKIGACLEILRPPQAPRS